MGRSLPHSRDKFHSIRNADEFIAAAAENATTSGLHSFRDLKVGSCSPPSFMQRRRGGQRRESQRGGSSSPGPAGTRRPRAAAPALQPWIASPFGPGNAGDRRRRGPRGRGGPEPPLRRCNAGLLPQVSRVAMTIAVPWGRIGRRWMMRRPHSPILFETRMRPNGRAWRTQSRAEKKIGLAYCVNQKLLLYYILFVGIQPRAPGGERERTRV